MRVNDETGELEVVSAATGERVCALKGGWTNLWKVLLLPGRRDLAAASGKSDQSARVGTAACPPKPVRRWRT